MPESGGGIWGWRSEPRSHQGVLGSGKYVFLVLNTVLQYNLYIVRPLRLCWQPRAGHRKFLGLGRLYKEDFLLRDVVINGALPCRITVVRDTCGLRL